VTGSVAIIRARMSVPLSEALKSTLEIWSGSIGGVAALSVNGFGVNPPIHRSSSSKSLNGQTFGG